MIGANTEHMCVSPLDRNPWRESTMVCGAVACDYISNFSFKANPYPARGSKWFDRRCCQMCPWHPLALACLQP